MSIYQLTDADVEAVVNQLKAGRSMKQVADELGISVEMVLCATRKWPELYRRSVWRFF